MKLTITPAKLQGTITPPPSKSHAHRLLIAAGLSGGRSTVRNVSQSKDIQATLSCLAAMGAVPKGVRCVAVDTAKQANYVTGCYPEPDAKLQVCYGTTDECIDAALTGHWHGGWK